MNQTKNTKTQEKSGYDLLESNFSEDDEYGFRAIIKLRIHNPEGDDVIAIKSYRALPKFDDLMPNDEIMEDIKYWWPNSYPADGDTAFTDGRANWTLRATNYSTAREAAEAAAENDPVTELEGLKEEAPKGSIREQRLIGGA